MHDRRASDNGLTAQAARTAQMAGKSLFDWAEKRKVAAHVAMAVCLFLTYRIAEWAMDYPIYSAPDRFTGVDIAAVQAGVLGPWGLMQAAFLKFYIDLVKNGHSQP